MVNKTKIVTRTIWVLFLTVFAGISTMQAQKFTLNNGSSELTIFGTSNVHDWEETAEKQSGSITLSGEDSKTIDAMEIAVEAESLKSGKSGMDNNTYKALNTDKYKTINFKLTEVSSMEKQSDGSYSVKAKGDLTLSGVTKNIDLNFKLTNSGNSVTLTGEKEINMTHYKIDPPRALMGAIKTGESVTLKFKTVLNQ
ncbi:YceI family protein [Robertkochia solimangrovi]|uniref:YceI family protein n=1 Tax=Robertkochia solimangrovi TaxID=2213046 RepID=UPI00117CED12|nr:YceI family protein [Robertkochia solimangrovi]TRZ46186.1 YceI family protein [Robertkochia solimangrovi]